MAAAVDVAAPSEPKRKPNTPAGRGPGTKRKAGDWVVAAGGHLLREGEAVAPVDRDNRPVAAAGAVQPKAD